MDFMKPILKNPKRQPMSSDVEQLVTINVVHYPEKLKNELEEGELSIHLRIKPWRQLIYLSQVKNQQSLMCMNYYNMLLYTHAPVVV